MAHVQRESEAKAESTSTSAEGEKPAEGEKTSQKMAPKKMYYLSCLACRWTSRDVGLPDQPNGTMTYVVVLCTLQFFKVFPIVNFFLVFCFP